MTVRWELLICNYGEITDWTQYSVLRLCVMYIVVDIINTLHFKSQNEIWFFGSLPSTLYSNMLQTHIPFPFKIITHFTETLPWPNCHSMSNLSQILVPCQCPGFHGKWLRDWLTDSLLADWKPLWFFTFNLVGVRIETLSNF